MPFELTPEIDLLLTCLPGQTQDRLERIQRLIRRSPDWGYLFRIALRHHVLAPLAQHLERAGADGVPVEVREGFRSFAEWHTARNLVLTEELLKILDRLAEHGVEAIPFKGPPWSLALYGDVTRREFSDLDILVRRADVPRARELLYADGYHPRRGVLHTPALSNEIGFASADGVVIIDLHWSIVRPYVRFPLAFDELLERCTTVSLLDRPTRQLSPEDMLLILAVCVTKQLWWVPLIYVGDIAAAVQRNPSANWSAVVERARALRARRMMAFSLRIARDLLAFDLPPSLASLVEAEAHLEPLVDEVRTRMFQDPPPASFPPRLETRMRYLSNVREDWRDKARPYLYAAAAALTAQHNPKLQLGRPWKLLHSLARPVRRLTHAVLHRRNASF